MDTTTAKSYAEVNEQGLLQFGHSKDHRPDLGQLKIVLASLDPLGMPLATEVLSGESADDPVYEPVLQESIRRRNPYVDPLSYFQTALLRRLRELGGPLTLNQTAQQTATPEEIERAQLTYAVLLTINGIAAGLRNTG